MKVHEISDILLIKVTFNYILHERQQYLETINMK